MTHEELDQQIDTLKKERDEIQSKIDALQKKADVIPRAMYLIYEGYEASPKNWDNDDEDIKETWRLIAREFRGRLAVMERVTS